jgi:Holliday junction resolvase RusA-like endonuclease
VTESRITIPGKVETNHRARVTRNGTFHAKEYVAYKRAVHLTALSSRPRDWRTDCRYHVTIVIHEPDARRRDVDNAAKGVLDGCRKALWDDDRQIDRLEVLRGVIDRENPRVHVHVRCIEEQAA